MQFGWLGKAEKWPAPLWSPGRTCTQQAEGRQRNSSGEGGRRPGNSGVSGTGLGIDGTCSWEAARHPDPYV